MLQPRTGFSSFLFAVLLLYLASSARAQNSHYSALLNDSLHFYHAQRSGRLLASNPVPWRHDSALNDGSDNHVDLLGGYYDAGDYLKFTMPLAHTLTLVAWGVLEWGDGYALAKKTDAVLDMLKWGTDWLIKAHPSDSLLFVQVGDGNVDHNYWGPDTNIPGPRPSYFIDQSHPGTDVASLTAAAFASTSILFERINATYSDVLVHHAEALYAFAETATPWQVYTERSVPASVEYYGGTHYASHLVLGALWLYRATANATYLDKASNYYHMLQLSTNPVAVYDWSDQTGAVYILGAAIDPSTVAYKTAALNYLNAIIDGTGNPCRYTPGGLLWCGAYSDTNSLVIATDIAFLALMYDTTVAKSVTHFTTFGISQINYLLGQNPMQLLKTPYVVGVHHNAPRNPHHAGASGGLDIENIDTSPPHEKYVLYGAVVGGPDKNDMFFDERSDWSQTEVALDYNAPAQSLFAYQIMTNASNPPYVGITDTRPLVTRSGSPPSSSSSSSFGSSSSRPHRRSMPAWSIAVASAGSVLMIIFVALLLSGYLRRQQQHHHRSRAVGAHKQDSAAIVIQPEPQKTVSAQPGRAARSTLVTSSLQDNTGSSGPCLSTIDSKSSVSASV
ncbi:Six-hairpin glycosidase-like protein [Dichotomocladium elegans]|nr:Six-hairpin glycosidase-like protein [Dichotomocladium elegans]